MDFRRDIAEDTGEERGKLRQLSPPRKGSKEGSTGTIY